MKDKNIVIGITGGIAAYKAIDVINKLVKEGAKVTVIMTKNATNFVTPLTIQTISKNKIVVDMFNLVDSYDVEHISLAKSADLFLIVPATANIIGKVACGIADDMLSTTIMATKAKVVFAPAMNDNMYDNPIVQMNINKLRDFGYLFIEPQFGNLACGTKGLGKLASVDTIVNYVKDVLKEDK